MRAFLGEFDRVTLGVVVAGFAIEQLDRRHRHRRARQITDS